MAATLGHILRTTCQLLLPARTSYTESVLATPGGGRVEMIDLAGLPVRPVDVAHIEDLVHMLAGHRSLLRSTAMWEAC
jgi:hypothetical protein